MPDTDNNDAVIAMIYNVMDNVRLVQILEKHVGINRNMSRVFVCFIFVCIAMILIITADVTTIVGCVYPIYKSIQAIENNQDIQEWFPICVVLLLFVLSERLVEPILGWLPFYYMIKLSVFIYMGLPSTKGGVLVYNNWVRPAFPYLSNIIVNADYDLIKNVIVESYDATHEHKKVE